MSNAYQSQVITINNYEAAIRSALSSLNHYELARQIGDTRTCSNCGMLTVETTPGLDAASRITVSFGHREILSVAVCSGYLEIVGVTEMVVLGETALTTFERTVRDLAFHNAGARRDTDGILRWADRSRVDGQDHVDLALGYSGGRYSEIQITEFHKK